MIEWIRTSRLSIKNSPPQKKKQVDEKAKVAEPLVKVMEPLVKVMEALWERVPSYQAPTEYTPSVVPPNPKP